MIGKDMPAGLNPPVVGWALPIGEEMWAREARAAKAKLPIRLITTLFAGAIQRTKLWRGVVVEPVSDDSAYPRSVFARFSCHIDGSSPSSS